jgi:hypothetical protein
MLDLLYPTSSRKAHGDAARDLDRPAQLLVLLLNL